MEEVGKYEIRVQKVGRKWLTIEGRCSKSQVEINELTKDFVEGGVYDIYAKCVTDSNRYGTTKKYYPISKEEAKNFAIEQDREKCKDKLKEYARYTKRHDKTRERIEYLAHNDEDLLNELSHVEKDLRLAEDRDTIYYLESKIRSAKRFDSSSYYKLNYIQGKLRDFPSLIARVKNEQADLYEELKELVIETHKELIFNIGSHIARFEIYEGLEKIYKDEDLSSLLKELKEKHEVFCLNKVKGLEDYYKKGFPVLCDIYSKEDYDKLRDKGYISDLVDSSFEDMENKMKTLDVSKLNYTIRNVFDIKDEDSFRLSMKSLNIKDKTIDEIFDKNKFRYDNKIYILSYRLEKDFFKKAKDEKLLVRSLDDDYTCSNPYRFLFELVEEGYIEIKENSGEHDSEIEKILLWSDELTEPFSYRKELVNGETYYFVTKELYSQYYQDNYNAYYIVGWDSDTKRGFSHRLPWFKDKYENMSIKNIVEDTFKLNQGYKRIQGDVIAKEYNMTKVVEPISYLKQIITINDKVEEYEINSRRSTWSGKSEDVSQEKYEGKEFKEKKIQYRKNMYVVGEKLEALRSFYDDVFKNAVVYCDDKEILRFDTPIRFNQDKIGTKIKYNLYYEDVKCEISYETRSEDDIYYLIEDEKGDVIHKSSAYGIENINLYLGEHLVNSNVIERLTRGAFEGTRVREIYCLGKFNIKHSEHRYVEYGEDNKVYRIELATRHKKKDAYIRD